MWNAPPERAALDDLHEPPSEDLPSAALVLIARERKGNAA
jgi:hypothetical protein